MHLSVSQPQTEIRCLVLGPAPILSPEASIRDAAVALRAMNASAALVAGPESIVTERDLTRAWSDDLKGDEPVQTIATEHPIVVSGDTPILDAAALMLNREVRHLIVIDHDEAGIVSLRAVMAVLLQAVHPEMWLSALRISITEGPELWLG
jgi:signal-transduction protein with cAMP-binding, CBS, and nucleotidyltransferase domain